MGVTPTGIYNMEYIIYNIFPDALRGYSTTLIDTVGPGDAAGHVSGRAPANLVPGVARSHHKPVFAAPGH